MDRPLLLLSLLLSLLLFLACAPREPDPAAPPSQLAAPDTAPNPLRNAYFGDLHVHTLYSFDAFLFGTKATPDDAYRYARGGTLQHPAGYEIRLESGPLDFYAVTDHGVFLGHLPAMVDPSTEISKLPVAQQLAAADTIEKRGAVVGSIRPYVDGGRWSEILDLSIVRSAWQEIAESANRNYEPGKFTTFIGYEYSSGADFQNLHRNVIFRGSEWPELPFSRLDSSNPEDLWAWMDGLRDRGLEALAIPHNSNGSNGQMFELETFAGDPLLPAYAEQRMRNEPLVEITQVKGTSDAHPLLSPNDEWAEFEIFPYRTGSRLDSAVKGSYVREAYLNGLELEEKQGFNPYRFGLIGSSDTHNAASSVEEDDFFSKVGLFDGTAQRRGSVPLDQPGPDGEKYSSAYYRLWGASGLAGAWAEENTRESLYDAFRRKETFATSGPRIRLRFFAGYDLPESLAGDDAISRAYDGGVPMGADLPANGEGAPRFLVWATRDPASAPLQRVQLIKGWIDGGEARERVYDVACSDGGQPDAESHRCPQNGATVNLSDCSFSEDLGAAELMASWSDPDFEPGVLAFYYLRVLENPTCRWSTWDAIRAGVDPRSDLVQTIQERAWSSPIWYLPGV